MTEEVARGEIAPAAPGAIALSPVPGGGWVPVPDPTKLTNEAVDKAVELSRRELANLREIIETRLKGNDEQRELLWNEVHAWPPVLEARLERRRREFLEDLTAVRTLLEQRLDALDKSIKLAADGLAALPDLTESHLSREREFILGQIANASAETRRVADVAQEKFAAIEGTFASNALALTAALAAQKEAAAEQNKSNTLAISKSEQATKETILANAAQTVSSVASQAATISDLKDRVVRLEAMGVGAQVQRADARDSASNTRESAALLLAQEQARQAVDSARSTRLMSLVVAGIMMMGLIVTIIALILKK